MNKDERLKLQEAFDQHQPFSKRVKFIELLDYVDTLEAACEYYADRDCWGEDNMGLQSDQGNRAREALNKGK